MADIADKNTSIKLLCDRVMNDEGLKYIQPQSSLTGRLVSTWKAVSSRE